jgi:hypothetical protein
MICIGYQNKIQISSVRFESITRGPCMNGQSQSSLSQILTGAETEELGRGNQVSPPLFTLGATLELDSGFPQSWIGAVSQFTKLSAIWSANNNNTRCCWKKNIHIWSPSVSSPVSLLHPWVELAQASRKFNCGVQRKNFRARDLDMVMADPCTSEHQSCPGQTPCIYSKW